MWGISVGTVGGPLSWCNLSYIPCQYISVCVWSSGCCYGLITMLLCIKAYMQAAYSNTFSNSCSHSQDCQFRHGLSLVTDIWMWDKQDGCIMIKVVVGLCTGLASIPGMASLALQQNKGKDLELLDYNPNLWSLMNLVWLALW